MLFRLRAGRVPRVVRDDQQEVRAVADQFARGVGAHVLVADHDPGAHVLREVDRTERPAGREVAPHADQPADGGELVVQRDELAERHDVDLVVTPRGVRVILDVAAGHGEFLQQERRVEHVEIGVAADVVVGERADQERRFAFADHAPHAGTVLGTDRRAAVVGGRNGGLRPDDQLER